MKRDLRKAIQEYDRRFGEGRNGAMYASDMEQILTISGYREKHDVGAVIIDSMKAAFMLGYRKGIKDSHNI